MAPSQSPLLPCSDTLTTHPVQQLPPLLHPMSAPTNDTFLLQDICPPGVVQEGSCTAARHHHHPLLLQLDSARVDLARATQESDRLRDLLRAVARERDAARHQCRQALLLLQLHLGAQLLDHHPSTPGSPVPSLPPVLPHPPFLLNENTSVATASSSQGQQQQQQLVLHHQAAAPPPSASSSDDSSIVSSPPLPHHGEPVHAFASPPPPNHSLRSDNTGLDEPYCAHRPLPDRGRLLEAVLNAGPLLQDLLLMGPLPQWHNPPPPPPSHGLDVLVPAATFATASVSSAGNARDHVQGLGKRKERDEGAEDLFML